MIKMKKYCGKNNFCMALRRCAAVTAAAAVVMLAGCAVSSLPKLPDISDEDYGEERYRLAQDHFIMARDCERRGRHEMALRLYEAAYDFLPESPYLRKTLAEFYIRIEEYDKALALFGEKPEIPKLTLDEKRTLSRIYHGLGDMAKAAEALEAVGADKTEEEVYSLAFLYERSGQLDKAMLTFKDFFMGGPHLLDVGIKLLQFSIAERKLAEAEVLAAMLREIFPENAEVVALLGTARYLKRDTAGAIALFHGALALDSLNEDALRTLAHIHVVREQYPEAIAFYRRLMAQEELGAVYRRGLAFLLFHIDDFEAAEPLLDTLIGERDDALTPGRHELRLYRGLLYSKTGRKEKAAEEFRAVIAADSTYEDAWKELFYLHILAKEYEKALAVADEYLAAFPKSGAGWRFRGYALNAVEKRDEAVLALRKAVAVDSLDYFSWFELGSTLERQKRVDEAAYAFKRVLRIRPKDAPASNYLGYMWAEAGVMLDSARQLIEDALEKEPKNGAYLDSYAWVYYQLGDYEKAHRYMKEAFAYADDDPVLYEHLGDILFKLNDYSSAEAAYKRSLDLKSEEAARIGERLAEIKKLMKKER
jgi:tetratricopeptide (TPR) repeat protein